MSEVVSSTVVVGLLSVSGFFAFRGSQGLRLGYVGGLFALAVMVLGTGALAYGARYPWGVDPMLGLLALLSGCVAVGAAVALITGRWRFRIGLGLAAVTPGLVVLLVFATKTFSLTD